MRTRVALKVLYASNDKRHRQQTVNRAIRRDVRRWRQGSQKSLKMRCRAFLFWGHPHLATK